MRGDSSGAGGEEEPKLQPTDVPWSPQPTETVLVVKAVSRDCLPAAGHSMEVALLLVDVPLLGCSDEEDARQQAGEQGAAGEEVGKGGECGRLRRLGQWAPLC